MGGPYFHMTPGIALLRLELLGGSVGEPNLLRVIHWSERERASLQDESSLMKANVHFGHCACEREELHNLAGKKA